MADYEFSTTKLDPVDAVQMLAINGSSPGYVTGEELKAYITGAIPSGVPIGAIMPYTGEGIPNGFLDCNGAEVSRSTYAALFAVVGTIYGEGDGYSTFTLPNLNGRFMEGGAEAGEYKEAGLPNIKGEVDTTYAMVNRSDQQGIGIFEGSKTTGGATTSAPTFTNTYSRGVLKFDASQASGVYKDDVTTVQPASLVVRFVIKAYDYNADPTPVSEFEAQLAAMTSQIGALQNELNNRRHVIEENYSVPASGKKSMIWYRRYNDGWLEQGFLCSNTATTGETYVLTLPFRDGNWWFSLGTANSSTSTSGYGVNVRNATDFKLYASTSSERYVMFTAWGWEATT